MSMQMYGTQQMAPPLLKSGVAEPDLNHGALTLTPHFFSLMYKCCKNKTQCNTCPHWQFAGSDCFPPLLGEHLQLQAV